jgi:hypothetical protein
MLGIDWKADAFQMRCRFSVGTPCWPVFSTVLECAFNKIATSEYPQRRRITDARQATNRAVDETEERSRLLGIGLDHLVVANG